MSKECEILLQALARPERNRRWQVEYAEFLAAYNVHTEEAGLPLDQWRMF